MAAKDAIKDAVVAALRKDGWTITHDPLRLEFRDIAVGIDLGAERLIAAERGVERIALEIKGLTGDSPVRAYRDALGQFDIYRMILDRVDPGRKRYLAVGDEGYNRVFGLLGIQDLAAERPMPMVIVTLATEEVERWTG